VNILGLQRNELEGLVQEYIRKDILWKPDILLVKKDAHLVVVKDYAYQPFLYRFCVGTLGNYREIRTYRKLNGVQGIRPFLAALTDTRWCSPMSADGTLRSAFRAS